MYCNTTLFIATTLSSFISAFFQIVIKLVLSYIFKESLHSKNVRSEIAAIRSEMSQFSMMDEFARWARLQRKLIKLEDEVKSERKSLTTTRLKYKFIVSSSSSVIIGLISLVMIYMYRAEVVLILPESWLFPFSSLIAWPSQEAGAVSVFSWVAVSNYIARRFARKFK